MTIRLSAFQSQLEYSHAAGAKRWPNVDLMLAQRLRRWPNMKPTSSQCFVSAGSVQEYYLKKM